jgi:hypothetical protein
MNPGHGSPAASGQCSERSYAIGTADIKHLVTDFTGVLSEVTCS